MARSFYSQNMSLVLLNSISLSPFMFPMFCTCIQYIQSPPNVSKLQGQFLCFCNTLNTFGVQIKRWTREKSLELKLWGFLSQLSQLFCHQLLLFSLVDLFDVCCSIRQWFLLFPGHSKLLYKLYLCNDSDQFPLFSELKMANSPGKTKD